jgi:hypothetical protein
MRRDLSMAQAKEQFILDGEGKPAFVVLDAKEYERMVEELEELADIRAYDEAKASGEAVIPFEQAIAEIEKCNRSARTASEGRVRLGSLSNEAQSRMEN